jgi:hypothetical protein
MNWFRVGRLAAIPKFGLDTAAGCVTAGFCMITKPAWRKHCAAAIAAIM